MQTKIGWQIGTARLGLNDTGAVRKEAVDHNPVKTRGRAHFVDDDSAARIQRTGRLNPADHVLHTGQEIAGASVFLLFEFKDQEAGTPVRRYVNMALRTVCSDAERMHGADHRSRILEQVSKPCDVICG
jgi:hypothetical protein